MRRLTAAVVVLGAMVAPSPALADGLPGVSDVTSAVTSTVQQTTSAAATTVQQVAAPVTDTVQQATETVQQATAPVTDTVQQVTAPVTDTVEQVAPPAQPAAAPTVPVAETPAEPTAPAPSAPTAAKPQTVSDTLRVSDTGSPARAEPRKVSDTRRVSDTSSRRPTSTAIRRTHVAPPHRAAPPEPAPVHAAKRASSPAQQPLLPPAHAPKAPGGLAGAVASHGGTSTGFLFALVATLALAAPGASRRLRRLVDRPVPPAFFAVLERPG